MRRLTLCKIGKQDGAGRTSDRDADLREIQSGVSPMGSSTAEIVLRRSPVWGRNSHALDKRHDLSMAGRSARRERIQLKTLEAAS